MPYLELVESGESFLRVRVAGLQNPSSDYSISIKNTTTGQEYYASGGGQSSDGTYYTNGQTFTTSISCGLSYDFEASVTPTGSFARFYYGTFSTLSCPNPRPSDFNWTNSKNSGSDYNLNAEEWNYLTLKINEFRGYKGVSAWYFTSAGVGNTFTAQLFNEAVNALSGIPDKSINEPYPQSSGNIIYASDLNGLKDSLNSTS